MLLSIIIPAYNAEPYIFELLECLKRQMVPDVEVIVIDDGSQNQLKIPKEYNVTLKRQKNAGAAAARNTGIELSKGDYIAFIDADDLVVEDYLKRLISVIKSDNPDYIYLSWKAFGGWDYQVFVRNLNDKFPPFNLCVWNRVYKRSMIGDVRFNTNKVVAEDAQFIRDVKEEGKKKAVIADIMYLYRANTPNSLTKRVSDGRLKHRRIVYNLPVVPNDPKLLEEIKEADKTAEVIVLTNQNNLKGLEEFAMVIPPRQITGSELRGEPTPNFRKQPEPIVVDVVLYVDNLFTVGGIETFTYNFCYLMRNYYDIAVCYSRNIAPEQLKRLLPLARVVKLDKSPIFCKVAINCRMVLHCPDLIKAEKNINLVHTCKMKPTYMIKDSQNDTYFVSEVARESFQSTGGVIYNLCLPPVVKDRPIRLVSACRLTWEKGQNRTIELARMISDLGLSYSWEVFTPDVPEIPCNQLPDGLMFRQPTLNICEHIAAADFYVSMSDYESFGFSMVEALQLGVPVISTAIPVLQEIGFQEGINGFSIPLDLKQLGPNYLKAILTTKLKFKYSRDEDNERSIKQWRSLIGEGSPVKRKAKKGCVYCVALKTFQDDLQGRIVQQGEYVQMPRYRAEIGSQRGFYAII